jgi:N-methylhydantoinase A
MKMDMVRTRYARLSEMDWSAVEALLQGMEESLSKELASAGVARERITFRRSADMRYVGQGFEVETELPTRLVQAEQSTIEASFAQAYAARFGGKLVGQRVEAVNWRVEASAHAAHHAEARRIQRVGVGVGSAQVERSRQVFFPDLEGFVQTPVLLLEQLRAEQRYEGPALVEQTGSTVVIGPGDMFTLDTHGNLRITLGARQGRAA